MPITDLSQMGQQTLQQPNGYKVMGSETNIPGLVGITNLLSNSSFENGGMAFWTNSANSGTYSIDTSTYKFGTQSLKITGSGSELFDQTTYFIAGHKYYACYWRNITSYTSGSHIFELHDANGTIILGMGTSATTSGWQFVSGMATPTITGQGYTRVGQWSSTTCNLVTYFDGICVIDLTASYGAGNEPTQAQMDSVITALGGWFEGMSTITKIPTGVYQNNGSANGPELLVNSIYAGMGASTQVQAIYTLQNLVNNGNFENGITPWVLENGNGSISQTTGGKFGTYCCYILGTTTSSENYMSQTLPYIQGHQYYVSCWVDSSLAGITSDFYFPEISPYPTKQITCTVANTWYHNSFISNNASIASGNYNVRIDNNNVNNSNYLYVDGVCVIDLTATFGSGNEPTLSQMDNLMTTLGGYFDGTALLQRIPQCLYLKNGVTGGAEVVTSSSTLTPSNITRNATVLGVTGTGYAVGASITSANLTQQSQKVWQSSITGRQIYYGGIAVAPSSGNVYVATDQNTSGTGPTVHKLNSSGGIVWENSDYLMGDGICVDSSENVYIAYYSNGARKMTSTGAQVWIYSIGAWSITSASSGNVYVGTNSGGVYKLNSSGTMQWGGHPDGNPISGVVVDSSENVYAVNTNGTFKLSSSTGSIIWQMGSYSGNTTSLSGNIGIDSSANVYVCCTSNTIAKVNSSGIVVWIRNDVSNPLGICADASGNSYVAYNNATSSTNITSNITLASYDTNGNLRWKNSDQQYNFGVTVDNNGYAYVLNQASTTQQIEKLSSNMLYSILS